MTARTSDDHTSDVRGLLAELGDLVGDLGLDEPVAKPKRARAKPAAERSVPVPAAVEEPAAEPTPPEWEDAGEPAAGLLDSDRAELTELAAALEDEAVPLWETSDPTHEPELVPLWDAFAPELDSQPPRPWSLQAAMETVEPAAPPRGPDAPRPALLLRLARAFRPRIFTVATVAAVLIAAAVVVLTRLDFSHTSGPTQPVSKAAFELSLMRTVDSTSAATVAQAPTLSTFPAHTTQVYMDVVYRNAAPGDTLRLVINLLPPAGSGGNPVLVGDQTHTLPAGGEIAVTIQGPATGFSPGDYTVTAFHDGHLEQSLTFTISPAPAAKTTPSE